MERKRGDVSKYYPVRDEWARKGQGQAFPDHLAQHRRTTGGTLGLYTVGTSPVATREMAPGHMRSKIARSLVEGVEKSEAQLLSTHYGLGDSRSDTGPQRRAPKKGLLKEKCGGKWNGTREDVRTAWLRGALQRGRSTWGATGTSNRTQRTLYLSESQPSWSREAFGLGVNAWSQGETKKLEEY